MAKDKYYLSAEDIEQNQHIPSVRYRERIKKLSKKLTDIPGVEASVVFVILKTGEKAWLGNTPALQVAYADSGYSRGEYVLEKERLSMNKTFYTKELHDRDEQLRGMKRMREEFALHQSYVFTRSCTDCSILTTCNAEKAVTNDRAFCAKTLSAMEDWTIYLLDNTMDIFCEELPALAKSRFARDQEFRHQVIKNRNNLSGEPLSEKETEVLYWSAQGMTAREVAAVTHLSEETVSTYRKRCIQKLQAKNITHAIYLATTYGLIV